MAAGQEVGEGDRDQEHLVGGLLDVATGTKDRQRVLTRETRRLLPVGGAVVEHGRLSPLSSSFGERELLGKAVAGDL